MIEEKKRRGKVSRMVRRFSFRIVLLGIIVLALGTGLVWTKNQILAGQVRVVTAQEGSLEVPLETEALIANTETVVTAGSTGKVEKLALEGERIRKGGVVCRVSSQTSGLKFDLNAPISGAVSYNVDGLEGILTPKNVTEWDLAKFKELKPSPPPGELVQGGQGVFKLVDNLLPTYLIFQVPKKGLVISAGDKVNLGIGEQRLSAKAVKISKLGPEDGVVVALPSFLTQALGKRTIKISWLDKSPDKGIWVPTASLQERQGSKGVFVLKDGVVTWQTVEILAQFQDKTCLKGLANGAAVIITPAYVKEGQVLNTKY